MQKTIERVVFWAVSLSDQIRFSVPFKSFISTPGWFITTWNLKHLYIPVAFMYGIFTFIWLIFMLNVGRPPKHPCHSSRKSPWYPDSTLAKGHPVSRHSVTMAVTKTMTGGHRVAKSIAEWPHFGHAVMQLGNKQSFFFGKLFDRKKWE